MYQNDLVDVQTHHRINCPVANPVSHCNAGIQIVNMHTTYKHTRINTSHEALIPITPNILSSPALTS